ncbi:hypothetical protein VTJ83DRAFT_6852 [Remersonia thermophila]|uniref:Uncharacterized protein n=1 Tax=Remersonia thermophila TaxID=72144 RepID=A0ABR4D644_9PEZI
MHAATFLLALATAVAALPGQPLTDRSAEPIRNPEAVAPRNQNLVADEALRQPLMARSPRRYPKVADGSGPGRHPKEDAEQGPEA